MAPARINDSQDGTRHATRSRGRLAAVALSALALTGGALVGGCGDDDDNEGLGEEAGKAIDTVGKEAGKAIEKGEKKIDKAVDIDVDEDGGKKGKGGKKR